MGAADTDSNPTGLGAPAGEVAPGAVIGGKYRLDALLGSGGMGTVWSCTHLTLGERMAIKIVSTSSALSQQVRARFAREARASARLKSRFTVRVFDSGELSSGTPYIVMEYLEGETLSQHLRRVGRLPLGETVRVLAQVGRGLQRAHEAGIVHRDIKPENVFLAHTSDDGVVAKVFDFGVAKLLEGFDAANSNETVKGTFVGTPQFMSPEQAMGLLDVDHRADIYSLGVLAHRMLTGRRLFDADSISALLIQICSGPLPKIRDALPELPPAVEDWFQRTCVRDRDMRYASATQCVDALAEAASGSPARDLLGSRGQASDLSGAWPMPVQSPVRVPRALPALSSSGVLAIARTPDTPPAELSPLRPDPDDGRRWRIAAVVGLPALVVIALIVVLATRRARDEPDAALAKPVEVAQPPASVAFTADPPLATTGVAPLEPSAPSVAVAPRLPPIQPPIAPRVAAAPAPKHADVPPAGTKPSAAKAPSGTITDVGY
jgi:serine/threonine-protein kinase